LDSHTARIILCIYYIYYLYYVWRVSNVELLLLPIQCSFCAMKLHYSKHGHLKYSKLSLVMKSLERFYLLRNIEVIYLPITNNVDFRKNPYCISHTYIYIYILHHRDLSNFVDIWLLSCIISVPRMLYIIILYVSRYPQTKVCDQTAI